MLCLDNTELHLKLCRKLPQAPPRQHSSSASITLKLRQVDTQLRLKLRTRQHSSSGKLTLSSASSSALDNTQALPRSITREFGKSTLSSASSSALDFANELGKVSFARTTPPIQSAGPSSG